MTATVSSVARTIYFYRLNTAVDEKGRPLPVNVPAMLDHLRSLPFSEGVGGVYLHQSDGTLNAGFDVEADRFKFGVIRRAALPLVELAGTVRDLKLAAQEGILETMHVVFFPNAIIGADYNFHGPRIPRLETYLRTKIPLAVRGADFTIDPLFQQDPLARLNKLGELTMVDLKLRRAHLDELGDFDDIFAGLRTTAALGNAETCEIVMRTPRKKRGLSRHVVEAIRTCLGDRRFVERAQVLRVRGFDGEARASRTLDLLAGKLHTKRPMLKLDPRSRAVDSTSAFQAIVDGYSELRDQLEVAVSVGVA